MSLISWTKIGLSAICFYLAYYVYWEFTIGSRRRALGKEKGCLPAQIWPCKDPILGIDLIVKSYKAIKEHNLLQSTHEGLVSLGVNTVRMKLLGRSIWMTNHPDNVKAMLALDFDSWSIGEQRIKEMSRFLGYGIFTTEGAAWKHSRDMLRPCFERSQVADLTILEDHAQALIKTILQDGSTVDLQDLFHRFTLDVATEFLFGESTNSLDLDTKNEEVDNFVEAFQYCQNPLEAGKSGVWDFITTVLHFQDTRFKRAAKTINGM